MDKPVTQSRLLFATRFGKTIDILNPMAHQFDPYDIAHQLSQINRFVGALTMPYSVAQHCVIGTRYIRPELRGAFLLHDAHEIITSDMITPIKTALDTLMPKSRNQLGFTEVWEKMTDNLDKAIYEAAGIPWPLSAEDTAEIKRIDLIMYATEVRDLTGDLSIYDMTDYPDPAKHVIKPWNWTKACDTWIDTAMCWCPKLFNNAS